MIELCTRRRMIISIIALGVLTVLVLIFEERLTSESHWSQSPTPSPQNNESEVDSGGKRSSPSVISSSDQLSKGEEGCWLSEGFKIVTECTACTHFEINSGSIPACELTGLKETVQCAKSGTVFRSCSILWSVEKTRFWIFESLMLLTAVLSFGFAKFRTSQLERATIKQIERRLASGM